jgi:threonine dehydrogenase-like Zn-dependent dehydrogenase
VRALVKLAAAPGQVEVQERPAPEPGPSELTVRVRLAGLCHTDLSLVEWNQAARDAYRPAFPLVLGHEFTGTVEALGPGTTGPAPGTPVAGSAHLTCGECRMCRSGRSMLCPRLRVLGLDVDGVLATCVRLPARNVVPLPASVPVEVAALAEPFAVASHAVTAGELAAGERVAIIGPGAVGLCTLAAVLASGGDAVVFGLDGDRAQLDVARRMGASATAGVSAAASLAPDQDGGYDLVIETAGQPDAVASGVRLVRPGGRVVCVGLPSSPVPIDTAALARLEKRIIGVRAYDLGEWSALPGRLDAAASRLAPLVTHVVGLGEFGRAVELITSRTAIKVMVAPGSQA